MKNTKPGQTCCVIGYPICHSLSPVIHNTLYEIYKTDCEYGIREIEPGGLNGFVANIPANHICGFNVTMPYKKDIIPYLANTPDGGSVNSVAVRNGQLIGISTDEAGFLKSLQEKGFEYKGQKIVFIGAGAVAGALARDAAQKGAAAITLLNRSAEHAQIIAKEIGGNADSFNAGQTYDCIQNCDILINTTPQGMAGCPPFESFDFLHNVNSNALVCDLIYRPLETDFLKQAALQGNQTLGGISMLIWQAFYAFEHFFGILPNEQDKQIILEKIEKLI
jgi:shikimate dehydrogenase